MFCLKLGCHLDLPKGQLSQAYLNFQQGLVAEEDLGPSQSSELNSKENLWWDLNKALAAALKPKNITELEAIAHEECA